MGLNELVLKVPPDRPNKQIVAPPAAETSTTPNSTTTSAEATTTSTNVGTSVEATGLGAAASTKSVSKVAKKIGTTTTINSNKTHSRESSGASNLSVKFSSNGSNSPTASVSTSVGSSPHHRKYQKRQKNRTRESGTFDLTLSDRLSQEEEEEDIEDLEEDQDDDGFHQHKSCDSIHRLTPDSDDVSVGGTRMLPGDSKSQNSDYGSFCHTPSDNFVPPLDNESLAGQETTAAMTQAKKATSDGGNGGKSGANPINGAASSTEDHIGPAGDQSVDLYQRQPLLPDSHDSSSEDDAGANSSGYIRRKTRHHRGLGATGGTVRLDITETDDCPSETDSESHNIPGEPLKTLLAFIFLFLAWVATTTSLALTHERVPESDHLPDVFLDNVQYQPWGLNVSEILIMVSTWTAFLVTIFHKHRCIVLRRIFLLVGIHYYYRAITMYITVLPKSNEHYECAPKLNETTPLEIAQRVLKLLSGMGLSINGQHVYCGDYIYSGHTMTLIMGYMVIKEYSPRRFFLLHWLSLCTTLTGILTLLLARGHYSIDVLIAYWITTRLWWIYHTLCNNHNMKDSGNSNNYLTRMWWWYIFRYFEGQVPVVLPREFEWPLPAKLRKWKPTSYLFRRRSLPSSRAAADDAAERGENSPSQPTVPTAAAPNQQQ